MLTTLSTLKLRLAIPEADTTNDTLLTAVIAAISARFEHECRRSFARLADATFEFPPYATEICPDRYPIESVSRFELKSSESEGWLEQQEVQYLIRSSCLISFAAPLCTLRSSLCTARVTFTAGYVLPGSTPGPGQTPLPADLEHATLEQAAAWFQNRDSLSLIRNWPSGGTYRVFLNTPLLASVAAILNTHRRYIL